MIAKQILLLPLVFLISTGWDLEGSNVAFFYALDEDVSALAREGAAEVRSYFWGQVPHFDILSSFSFWSQVPHFDILSSFSILLLFPLSFLKSPSKRLRALVLPIKSLSEIHWLLTDVRLRSRAATCTLP